MKHTKHPLRFLLYPISIIYGIIVSIRNFMFEYKILPSREFNFPIISVGNLTVGGTGKTPHIEYLVKLLKKDFKIATLSRGYKRKTSGFVLATKDSKVKDIGDEPKQIKQKFPNIPVAVDANRVKGIKNLMKEINPDIILLDDAFQHRYVISGLSILLIDYNRPIDEDYLLPYGELRESRHGMRRANIIMMTKTPKDIKPIEKRIIEKNLKPFPYQTLYFTTFSYAEIEPVYKEIKAKKLDAETIKKQEFDVMLVTGIARPEELIVHLEENYTAPCEHLIFSDHHNFSKNDIQEIAAKFNAIKNQNKIILTTEKDAMRFQDLDFIDEQIKKQMYYVPLEIEIMNGDKNLFNTQITRYVKKNKKQTSQKHSPEGKIPQKMFAKL